MNEYRYFVSYSYINETGYGYGDIGFTQNTPINDYDAINQVRGMIMKNNPGFINVTIFNFRLFDPGGYEYCPKCGEKIGYRE